MKVQIIGAGCPKCRMLAANAQSAIDSLGIEAETEKITDIDEIFNMGVMITPAFAVDGDVKTAGQVLSVDRIIEILKGSE